MPKGRLQAAGCGLGASVEKKRAQASSGCLLGGEQGAWEGELLLAS